MRRLATFCFAFAAGVFAAQYLLPDWLLPYAAAGCVALGALWAWLLHGDNRRRAAIIGAALALALCYDCLYVRLVQAPFEALAGTQRELRMEAVDFPSETDYGSRVEVRVLDRGLHGKAVYYGSASLLDVEPGMRLTANVYVNSAATIRDAEVATHTSRGVFALLYARGEAAVEDGSAGSLRYLPQRLARQMQRVVAESFPARTRAFMNAILLGDRYDLATEDKTYLSEAGLYHVTAVSGLHCAFLLSLLSFLVGKHRRRLLSAVAIPILALYAVMVGLTPSVLRACIMMTFLLLAPLFRRESDPPTALSFALFLILAANPFAVKSVSLQLSFAAVSGMIWLGARLFERIRTKKRSKAAYLALASLATTAGALVFTVPLTAFYFGYLVLLAPLSNLLCLWAATFTFAAGLIVTLLGMAFLPLARILAYLPHFGAWYLLTAAKWLTKIPYHAVYFANNYLKLWLVYAYAMFGVCYAAKRGKWRYVTASGLAVATLALTVWLNALPMHGGSLHMVALDVGQGQSVALHSKGATALMDCGSSSYVDAGDVTADYLQSAGIRKVDYFVLSHYHADHCNGLPVLLSRLKVGRFVLPDVEEGDALRAEVLALAERYEIPVTFVRRKEAFVIGDATLTVYPPVTEGDMNEECLTAVCTTGSFDALFTGDMDANTEYRVIASYQIPDIEVLMVGHHGSRYSTGGDLLAEVKPETGVISCGLNNRYGHPNEETLYRLTGAGVEVYRTDLQGNIHITVN
ncbi:MAG: DNA internalization-related competence protein ComEC/Rec2 [Oscillospiraceae bacterium]|nr:DNA internalization-related competence protein ComEC/Rec2 [Oscillospiraceae bacterium]